MLCPDLFNIYVKKTIEPLEDAGLNPLVYKDDLANIFDGEANLLKAIDIIEKWQA